MIVTKKGSFDTREELGDKIDNFLVMTGKLAPEIVEQVDNLNHKFTKVEAEYRIMVTMTNAIMISKGIRTNIGQIVETEDNIDRREVDLGMNKIIGEVISEIM